MKFSNDKKLIIYTSDIIKGSDDKMESSLKRELEATKSALKLQTVRCRQLVAAFTRKLHEKELELRASKDLRDQQLSRLLRALLILESRLKKEQKLIRQQLQEKDLIIQNQEKEISKLKTLEVNKWPNNKEDPNVWGISEKELPKTTGEERLDNLCKGLYNINSPYREELESQVSNKTGENTYKDNPVLESVNQILLRDEEELLNNVQPVGVSQTMFNESDSNEWYETNSHVVPEEQEVADTWCINIEERKETDVKLKKEVWAEKTSPIKSQHLEEKACLEMSKKNLTVVNLDEIDSNKTERAVSPAKSTASYEEIIPVSTNESYKSVRNLQKPPALPPKPARLLKPHQILQQKNQLTNSEPKLPKQPHADKNSPPKKPSANQTARQSQPETKESSEPERIRPKLPDPSSKPKKPQINGHVLSPVDCGVVPPHFGKPKKKEEPVCSAIKIGSSVSSLITGLSRETIVTELNGEGVNNSPDDSHVSQLVRQFEVLSKLGMIDCERTEDEVNDIRKNFEEFKLEESYVESVIEGEENGRHEGDGAETRNSVNYYATLTIVPPPLPKEPPPGAELEYKMYETFLENTGLSQKSILTPSRMLSNHRSCLKPKDVKHRNRVKAAAAIEKCNAFFRTFRALIEAPAAYEEMTVKWESHPLQPTAPGLLFPYHKPLYSSPTKTPVPVPCFCKQNR